MIRVIVMAVSSRVHAMFAWRQHDPKVTAEVLARLMRRLRSPEADGQGPV